MNTYYDIGINTYKAAVEFTLNTIGRYNLAATLCADALMSIIRSVVELECVDTSLLYTHDVDKVCNSLQEVGINFPVANDALCTIEAYHVTANYPGPNFVEVTLPMILDALGHTKNILEYINNYRVSKCMRIRNMDIFNFEPSVWRDYCLKYSIAEMQEEAELLRLESLHNVYGKDLYEYINKKYLYTTSHEESIPGNSLVREFNANLEKAVTLLKNFSVKSIRYGIFGSYSRGIYCSTSDIDILAIWNKTPDICSVEYSHLESDLERINCQITSVDNAYFKESSDTFAKNIRKDFKEIPI